MLCVNGLDFVSTFLFPGVTLSCVSRGSWKDIAGGRGSPSFWPLSLLSLAPAALSQGFEYVGMSGGALLQLYTRVGRPLATLPAHPGPSDLLALALLTLRGCFMLQALSP